MQDKKTLVTIIVLLVIFLPLSFIGTVKHFGPKEEVIVDDNPNKELIYNNKVYFYDNGVLLDTFDCSDCARATTVIDDEGTHINYYSLGEAEINPVIDANWAIFRKGEDLALYNMIGHLVANMYQAVKTYRTDATSQFMIAKYNNSWGVSFLDMSAAGIPFEYDMIALPSHFINGKLDTSKFIGNKGLLWYVLNPDGSAVRSAVRGEIVDFNDSYYVLYENGYHIYAMNNDEIELLPYLDKKNVYGVGKYLFVITNDNVLHVYEDCNSMELKNVSLPNYTNLYFSINDDGIAIMIDGNLYQTIEIS